ncbi:hypothetical protein JD276_04785 [Leucobacter sp. CSA1]|uniref:Acyltransferase 3 domain-containing protein n=1 Tax=Leucobacter chromiisoli TaxID=2796471 RepID=A0A934Q7N3_9MICO|nr:acyltransferase family protein [Leucobacter chromiisoli]MBK0418347.1 hypothetical protein [Leucobacter chromiisoli]
MGRRGELRSSGGGPEGRAERSGKERSGAIDAVRLLSVVAIVAGHIWGYDNTAKLLYTWHVPVFFFLSGYLWKPGRAVGAELRSRLRSLGRPYVAWLAILTVCLVAFGIAAGEDVSGDVAAGLYGGAGATQPYTTIWFVSVLFFATLGYRLLERLPGWARWAAILAGTASGYLWGPELAATPLSVASAVPCLVLLAAGAACRSLRSSIARPLLTGIALLAASAALILFDVSAPVDIKAGDYGTPVLSLLCAVAISFALVLVAERVVPAGRVSRCLTWLALPALAVVFAHPLFFDVPGPRVVVFAVAFLVPLAVGLIGLRTPLSPWLTGQERRGADRSLSPS